MQQTVSAKKIRRKTFVSFIIFFLLMGSTFAAWKWL
jgi:hypothetical protein